MKRIAAGEHYNQCRIQNCKRLSVTVHQNVWILQSVNSVTMNEVDMCGRIYRHGGLSVMSAQGNGRQTFNRRVIDNERKAVKKAYTKTTNVPVNLDKEPSRKIQ